MMVPYQKYQNILICEKDYFKAHCFAHYFYFPFRHSSIMNSVSGYHEKKRLKMRSQQLTRKTYNTAKLTLTFLFQLEITGELCFIVGGKTGLFFFKPEASSIRDP